jgi:hypothetical protein
MRKNFSSIIQGVSIRIVHKKLVAKETTNQHMNMTMPMLTFSHSPLTVFFAMKIMKVGWTIYAPNVSLASGVNISIDKNFLSSQLWPIRVGSSTKDIPRIKMAFEKVRNMILKNLLKSSG